MNRSRKALIAGAALLAVAADDMHLGGDIIANAQLRVGDVGARRFDEPADFVTVSARRLY